MSMMMSPRVSAKSGNGTTSGGTRPGMTEGPMKTQISDAPGYKVLCNLSAYAALCSDDHIKSITHLMDVIGKDNTISILRSDFTPNSTNFSEQTYRRVFQCLQMLGVIRDTSPVSEQTYRRVFQCLQMLGAAPPVQITSAKGYDALCHDQLFQATQGSDNINAALKIAERITPAKAMGILNSILADSKHGKAVLDQIGNCRAAIAESIAPARAADAPATR
jgi:hypothetical protein